MRWFWRENSFFTLHIFVCINLWCFQTRKIFAQTAALGLSKAFSIFLLFAFPCLFSCHFDVPKFECFSFVVFVESEVLFIFSICFGDNFWWRILWLGILGEAHAFYLFLNVKFFQWKLFLYFLVHFQQLFIQ